MSSLFLISSVHQKSWFWPRGMLSWFSPFPTATFVAAAPSQLMPHQAAAALAALADWPQAEVMEKSGGSSSDTYRLYSFKKLILLLLCTARFAALSYNLESGLPSRASRRWTVQEHFVGVHKVQFLSACTTWCKHKKSVCIEAAQDALYLPPGNKALTSPPEWATFVQLLESSNRVTLS